MDLELSGKKVLITGSTHGIGLEIAKAFHAEGALVALNGRDTKALNRSSKTIPDSIQCQGDVTDIEGAKQVVASCLKSFQSIDILICNVGSGSSFAPGLETYEEWQRVFSKNLWSTTNMIEVARDELIKSKGVIVCISSICGIECIENAPLTYSAAKAALNSYICGSAKTFGKQGVRINGIAPGNILFDGSVWDEKSKKDKESVTKFIEKNVALSTLGKPENIADLAVFLSSARSEFTSGAIWTVDGGQTH